VLIEKDEDGYYMGEVIKLPAVLHNQKPWRSLWKE